MAGGNYGPPPKKPIARGALGRGQPATAYSNRDRAEVVKKEASAAWLKAYNAEKNSNTPAEYKGAKRRQRGSMLEYNWAANKGTNIGPRQTAKLTTKKK